MKHFLTKRWLRLVVWAGGAALAYPARVWAHGPSTGGARTADIDQLFNITLAMAVVVFILVEGLITYAIIRHRRRSADEMPAQVHGNPPLEIAWTIISFLIIAVLFALTYRALQTDYRAEAENADTPPDLTVRVTGHMFYWQFDYLLPDEGDKPVTMAVNELHVPHGAHVLLEITASDVVHSFWVPELAGKVDAIPGHINTMWLPTDRVGTFTGQCAEYCGTLHWDMPITVHVMESQEFYETWLPEQMAFKPIGQDMETELPAGDPAQGEELFNSPDLACSGCHTAQDSVGPALSGMGERAESRIEGYSAEQYLRESILIPCAHTVEDFNCEIMPQDYGERLDAQMLADIIAYIEQHD